MNEFLIARGSGKTELVFIRILSEAFEISFEEAARIYYE